MKTLTTILIALLPMTISAQTTSPDVIASSGAYFSNATASLSWTLGEPVTETFANGDNILTQGFQQPVSVLITGIDLDLLVYLEGPFAGAQMNNTLNTEGVIPLSQPYNTPPWNYAGTESVGSIPNSNVVDWVLVELRDATDAGSATPATIIATQAAFLLRDGSVVGLDGNNGACSVVAPPIADNLFVVIWHRNHLGILSANALTQSAGVYTYDFSTGLAQVYNGGTGYKKIETGIYGMVAGDANADGEINTIDHSLWQNIAGTKATELSADFDMNVQVNNQDKNEKWYPNRSYESQVPE